MMRKIVVRAAWALAIVLFFVPSLTTQAKKNENVLMYFYDVNQEDMVGFIAANEHEQVAPDTFFVTDKYLFIDDTVNNRIMIYDDNKFIMSIPLQPQMDVKAMYYNEDNDNLQIIYLDRFNEHGSHYFYTSMALCESEVPIGKEVSNESHVLLEYGFDEKGNFYSEYLSKAESRRIGVDQFSYMNEDGSMELWIGEEYRIYSNYIDRGEIAEVEEYIICSRDGEKVTFATPEMHEDALGRGNIQVTKDGKIFQMTIDETGVRIYLLAKKEEDREESITGLRRVIDRVDNVEATPYSSYNSIRKATIRERMNTYFDLRWTYNSTLNSNLSVTGNPTYVSMPPWLNQYADGQNHSLTNVPYCWGGWNAETFVSNINNGKYAGNVNTSSSGHISGTVGMDCSGYVSVVFDLPYKHGTSNLSNCFTQLSSGSVLEAYDILNKAGDHVMIVAGTYEQGGRRYVDTYEETINSGKIVKTTGRYYQSLLNNGYVPMRYNYLQ